MAVSIRVSEMQDIARGRYYEKKFSELAEKIARYFARRCSEKAAGEGRGGGTSKKLQEMEQNRCFRPRGRGDARPGSGNAG